MVYPIEHLQIDKTLMWTITVEHPVSLIQLVLLIVELKPSVVLCAIFLKSLMCSCDEVSMYDFHAIWLIETSES